MDKTNPNSTMDLECSENPIMSSTRIEDSSSMSLLKDTDNTLNEGFLIDSASLSLSAVNYSNNQSEPDASRFILSELENTENSNRQNTFSELELEQGSEEGIERPEESSEMQVENQGDIEALEETEENIGLGNLRPSEEVDDEDTGQNNSGEENEPEYPVPQFPLSRVKKIMGICLNTEEKETEGEGKEKGRGNTIITKEASYVMALAVEYFVGTVGEMAGQITTSSKKKTMNMEHLRRALSDTEAFAFLEGCFQPSVIIGD